MIDASTPKALEKLEAMQRDGFEIRQRYDEFMDAHLLVARKPIRGQMRQTEALIPRAELGSTKASADFIYCHWLDKMIAAFIQGSMEEGA